MNNFPTKTLKLSTTRDYHISQLDDANKSTISIPLDTDENKQKCRTFNKKINLPLKKRE